MKSAQTDSGAASQWPLTHERLLESKRWKPLPAAVVLAGDAEFFKAQIIKRFVRELFGDATPDVARFRSEPGPSAAPQPNLATVLDELRTPSFFSPARLVIVEHGDAFLAEYGEDLAPFLEKGFGCGYLVVTLEGKLDGRTKFAKTLKQHGWLVECRQPYDRPPPWERNAPPWDSELSRWLVARAREKGLEMDLRTAFCLHERAGTDLAILDMALDKIATYVATSGSRRADEAAVQAVCGQSGEDTVFTAVERFLEGDCEGTLRELAQLLQCGARTDRDLPATDPASIALLFIGALIPRLRALRRAHALRAAGEGPERWIEAGLVQRPFLPRFERHMESMSPERIARILENLYEADKAIKSGANASWVLELLVLRSFATAG